MSPTAPRLDGARRETGWPPDLWLWEGVLDAAEAAELHDALLATVPWETHSFTIFGRTVPMPRRIQMFGPHGYRYSGVVHPPRPLGPVLGPLRDRLLSVTGLRFNSVLVNHYRDGRDSMGWHSDDDYPCGGQPWIASLSLGQARRFRLRERADHRNSVGIELKSGSLLLMGPAMQSTWQHALPRSARPMASRINLTWRQMEGS
jgi:alkylated DNA repair dioxygenase AlkB